MVIHASSASACEQDCMSGLHIAAALLSNRLRDFTHNANSVYA